MGYENLQSYISTGTRWFPSINWNIKFFGAHMQTVERGWLVPEESHHAFELIYILEGSQHTLMEGIRYELQEGDILFIPPGFKHVNQCLGEQGLTYFVAHFNVDDPLFRQKMSRSTRFYYHKGTEDNERLKEGAIAWICLLKRGGEYSISDLFKVQSGLFEILSILTLSISSNKEK
ncbi:AraC family transcriptional regulator, partial [Paenibacillus riograndensis]